MKRYYYIFKLYKEKHGNDLSDVTQVEVIASNYEEAVLEIPKIIPKGDNRHVYFHSVIAINEKEGK